MLATVLSLLKGIVSHDEFFFRLIITPTPTSTSTTIFVLYEEFKVRRGISTGRGHTGRNVFRSRAPRTFIPAQSEFQDSAFEKEQMGKPVLGVRDAVEGRTLDVNVLVFGIEVDVSNCGGFSREFVGDAHFLEKGRRDEVDVLARVGKYAHHGQCGETAHGSAIVVAGNSAIRVVELRWDVGVCSLCALTGSPGVMILIHGKEGLFVAKVEQSGILVQIVQTVDKCLRAAHELDERGLVVRHKE